MSGGATFETLLALDDLLVARGHRPLTPWWKEHLQRFYSHPTALTLIPRVGRGGAKSHSLTKIALNETLFGDFKVPPGECHFWAHVSIDRTEAAQRIRLFEKFLSDLRLGYDRVGEEIVLRDRPLGVRVLAAQIGSVSGWRCIGLSGDELAKWRSGERFANPAAEVIASLNATTVTHPRARKILCSSPLGMADYHFKRFELGNTPEQIVCAAPSWIANPAAITEQQTHELEPDDRIWRREYAAIPQAAALAAFDPDSIARAFMPPAAMGPAGPRVGIIDASSGKKDTWSYGICGWRACDEKPKIVFDKIDGFAGAFWKQLSGEEIVRRVSEAFKAEKVYQAHGDQRESFMVGAAFRRQNMGFVEHPWTSASKPAAVAVVRRWFADTLIVLPDHEGLRDELLSFEEDVTASGSFTFGARGSGHDDFVSLLITAGMADLKRAIPGSPSGRPQVTMEILQTWKEAIGRAGGSRTHEYMQDLGRRTGLLK